MTEFRCEKQVHKGSEYHTEKCGKPAKYALSVNGMAPIMLCGIHARKHIMAQKPWHKITELKKTVNVKP